MPALMSAPAGIAITRRIRTVLDEDPLAPKRVPPVPETAGKPDVHGMHIIIAHGGKQGRHSTPAPSHGTVHRDTA